MYDIYWTIRNEEDEKLTRKLRPIHLINVKGNPFPLKPGQTWIELVPNFTTFWETVESEKHQIFLNGRSRGSGYWVLYFKLDK